jgi:flagellar FliL protein
MTMTDVPEETVAAEPAAKKGKKGKSKKEKGGRSNLVPALVLGAGIAAGGYFMGGSGSEATATTETTVEPEIVEGPLLAVEPMTINLADGRYLRLGVSFQMTDAYEDAVEGEEGEAFAHHHASQVQDLLIATLGGHEVAALAGAEGRAEVKEELLHQVDEILDGNVMEIYFTEFVIQ